MNSRGQEFRGRLISAIKTPTSGGDAANVQSIVRAMLAVILLSAWPLLAQPPEPDAVVEEREEGENVSRTVRRFATDESISFSYSNGQRVVTLVATDHVLVRSKGGKYELNELPEDVVSVRSAASVSRSSSEMREIPVFQSDGGHIQAPIGGVLIYLQDDWSEGQVNQFFRDQGIDEAVEPLKWADRGYLIHTVPGVFAVELASRLAGVGGVKTVEPNFWQLMESR